MNSFSAKIEAPSIRVAGKPRKHARDFQQGMLLKLSLLMGAGALCWGLIAVWLGAYQQAIVPAAYISLTLVNRTACKFEEYKRVGCNFQIVLSILLPFIFQFLMGGLVSSGVVMLWSVVAMAGVLTFSRGMRVYLWLTIVIVLIVASILTDEIAQNSFANPIPLDSKWLFLLNIVACALTLFYVGTYFVRKVSAARSKLTIANTQLQWANSTLSDKNSELMEGLRYAESIQKAISPTETNIKHIFSNSFRIHRAKNYVSGDFLWLAQKRGWKIAACVDCTGHGIPGGLLGMLGYCTLNELLFEKEFVDPASLLTDMNKIVTKRLNQKLNHNRDGMEMTLVALNESKGILRMAGAGGSIHVLPANSSNATRYRINHQHVGGHHSSDKVQYTNKDIDVKPGDRIYMMTDGLPDQFGGEDNKKFSRKRVQQTIESLAGSPINSHGRMLTGKIDEWQGFAPQTDDILIFGFEV